MKPGKKKLLYYVWLLYTSGKYFSVLCDKPVDAQKYIIHVTWSEAFSLSF